MNEFELYETLKEAYETTTRQNNRFLTALNSVEWEESFVEDGETYYVKGGFTLTVENPDPFKEKWKPTAFFSDNTVKEF